MSTLFISDLHLSPNHPELAQQFLNLLQNCPTQIETLYILGDLFEVWIGDDDDAPFNQTIKKALLTLSQEGTQIYLMHGNRDFLLGYQFAEETGVQLLKDPHIIDLYGKRTLLTHGDTLCTMDTLYLESRKKLRNPLYQKFFLSFPLFLRKLITRYMRHLSQKRGKIASSEILDVVFNDAKQLMKEYDAEILIHGHTHRPSIEIFTLDNMIAQRIVLSDWHHSAHVLECETTGEFRLYAPV